MSEIDEYYRDKTKRTAETVELFLVWSMIIAIFAVLWVVGKRAFG